MGLASNQLSRYGAISKVLPLMAPAAKIFFVVDNNDSWFGDVNSVFPPDMDGNTRLFSDLNTAIAATVAGRGDVVLVSPNYTATVTAAAGLTAAVAGTSIIGVGNGQDKPTINFTTATTATFTITAANVTLKNFRITQGFDAVVSNIVVSAAGVTIEDCDFILADATYQATSAILTTAAANELTVKNNRFTGTADAGTAQAINLVGGTNIRIVNNIFYGAYTSSIGAINAASTATTNILIKGNYINNVTASSTKAMVLGSSCTGMICDNRMQILSGTAPITGAAMSWVGGNYYAATIATAGTLI